MINYNKKQNCFIFLLLLAFPFISTFANDDYNCTQFLSKKLTDFNLGTFNQPTKGKIPKELDSSKHLEDIARINLIISKLEERIRNESNKKTGPEERIPESEIKSNKLKLSQLRLELKQMLEQFEYTEAAEKLEKQNVVFDNVVRFGKSSKNRSSLVAFYKGNELVAYSTQKPNKDEIFYVSIQNSNCKISNVVGTVSKKNGSFNFNLTPKGCSYLLKNNKEYVDLNDNDLETYSMNCIEQGGHFKKNDSMCFCKNKIMNPFYETCKKIRAPHVSTLNEKLEQNLEERGMFLYRITRFQFDFVLNACEKYREELIDVNVQKEIIHDTGKKNGQGSMK